MVVCCYKWGFGIPFDSSVLLKNSRYFTTFGCMKKLVIYSVMMVVFLLFFNLQDADAQCAMCKASLENGDEHLAAGVNSAIQYLMLFPYLMIFTLGFLWYRASKRNKNNNNKSEE